jgi:hypothetical protein
MRAVTSSKWPTTTGRAARSWAAAVAAGHTGVSCRTLVNGSPGPLNVAEHAGLRHRSCVLISQLSGSLCASAERHKFAENGTLVTAFLLTVPRFPLSAMPSALDSCLRGGDLAIADSSYSKSVLIYGGRRGRRLYCRADRDQRSAYNVTTSSSRFASSSRSRKRAKPRSSRRRAGRAGSGHAG